MKIDLCKLFGVEEGEEFKVDRGMNYPRNNTYFVKNNILLYKNEQAGVVIKESNLDINNLNQIKEIIKLPKKKQFTDDELCILRNIKSEINTLGRNINGTIYVTSDYGKSYLKLFNNLFQSLDIGEEIIIDDYVER